MSWLRVGECWHNFDNITEIGVVPEWGPNEKQIYLIWYWNIGEKQEEGNQFTGWYETEEKAQNAMDRILYELVSK
jgi:hypothetical protein